MQTGKKAGSRPHLEGRVRKIVKDQLEEGKADAAPETLTAKRTFYMPYKLVVRETAGITKVKMVFDDGAEPHPLGNSSREYIYTYPSALIQRAFLQIGVREKDGDAFLFFFNTNGGEKHT